MASIITIFLFFIYLWGLGFTGAYFLKKPENALERNLMYLGVGLGILPILSILINLFRIPLDWKIFLILSIAFPLYILGKKIKNKELKLPSLKLKIKKSNIALVFVILIALFSLHVYTKGAFSYPYLEDEDPWGHAVGVKYVALEKTAYDPVLTGYENDEVLSYMDPYPPSYDIILGILHQTSPDLTWTLKFFNALIISLGFIFFYLFAKLFMGSRNKALLATFILAAIPSYLSHFIWAHSLVITLFFPTMYAFEKIKEDKKWAVIAAISLGSIWVAQNLSQPLKLTSLIAIYFIVSCIVMRKFLKTEFYAIVAGGILSFAWWGAMINKYSFKGFIGIWQPRLVTEATTSAVSRTTSIFSTIGDNNKGQLSFEKNINSEQIIGKAVFKIFPYVGWVKLIFFETNKPISEKGFCNEN